MASGLSRRMGNNKLLMLIDGKPMIEYILALVKRVDFEKVCVVSAYEEVLDIARTYQYETIFNSESMIGQSRSIILGINHLEVVDGYMFFTGDMPYLKKETIEALIQDIQSNPDHIIIPVYGENMGSPVYFPACFREELLALTGDQGGKVVIKKHLESVSYVYIEDASQGKDIDTMADLHKGDRS